MTKVSNNSAVKIIQKLYNGEELFDNQEEISNHTIMPTKESITKSAEKAVKGDSLSMVTLVIIGILVARVFIK